ncbi:hypothetical protein HanOQP8_Chr17g0679531 [Helianthus annuus]|nr:hypothetical protein HanHA89_Chr17g0726611 [Helianthus annuus]KAJ0637928.1 hypothetical protein HanOQP8_Chr17g0679531 [Helianthus annuus]
MGHVDYGLCLCMIVNRSLYGRHLVLYYDHGSSGLSLLMLDEGKIKQNE